MRPPVYAILFSAILFFALVLAATPSFGFTVEDGRVVRGRYQASGTVQAPGLTVRYLASRAKVNIFGRVTGSLTRQVVAANGTILQSGPVTLRGKCRSLAIRRGSFIAPATLRLSDGGVFRGSFRGLSASNQRPSRYFRGTISGNRNSRLLLRSL